MLSKTLRLRLAAECVTELSARLAANQQFALPVAFCRFCFAALAEVTPALFCANIFALAWRCNFVDPSRRPPGG